MPVDVLVGVELEVEVLLGVPDWVGVALDVDVELSVLEDDIEGTEEIVDFEEADKVSLLVKDCNAEIEPDGLIVILTLPEADDVEELDFKDEAEGYELGVLIEVSVIFELVEGEPVEDGL